MADARTRLARAAYEAHHRAMWPDGVEPVGASSFEAEVWQAVTGAFLDELMEPGEGAMFAGFRVNGYRNTQCKDIDGCRFGGVTLPPDKVWRAILKAIREGK